MGETTQIIQRRIRHWKTTIAGIALILAPVAGAIWPEYASKITNAAFLLAGGGFIAAADAQRPPMPPAP